MAKLNEIIRAFSLKSGITRGRHSLNTLEVLSLALGDELTIDMVCNVLEDEANAILKIKSELVEEWNKPKTPMRK